MAQAGLLLQLDASPHAWLEERGPRLSVVAAVDDATGALVGAVFRLQEDAHGYLEVLQQVVTSHGVPVAVYHDRHSIFRPVNQKETLEEQLAGQRNPTQFGHVLATLGIASITAHSPQAKGRIERLFGTLQDRLAGYRPAPDDAPTARRSTTSPPPVDDGVVTTAVLPADQRPAARCTPAADHPWRSARRPAPSSSSPVS